MKKPQQDPSNPADEANAEDCDVSPEAYNERRDQIRAYLKLSDTGETAQLAARMAPRIEEFDPSLLVERARALQTEVEDSLMRQRKAKAKDMSYETLFCLLSELGVRDWKKTRYHDDERLFHPVTGPALQAMHAKELPSLLRLAMKNEIDDALAKADTRTNLPRPDLPCSLEEALRYAADAPEVSLAALKEAYENCQRLTCHVNDKGETLGNLDRLSYEDVLKNLKSIKRVELPADFPGENPSRVDPGTITPAESNPSDTGEGFDEEEILTAFYMEDCLVELVEAFYPFWQKHGASYEKDHKTKAKRSKDAGHTGPSKRDRPRWAKRFKAFIASKPFKEFLQLEARLQSKPSYETTVANFLKGYNKEGTKSPSAKKKVRTFLVTLFTHRNKKMTPSELKGFKKTLDKADIKTIPDDLIKECHNKLNAKLDSAATTHQKKI